jgi:hypothetical protein
VRTVIGETASIFDTLEKSPRLELPRQGAVHGPGITDRKLLERLI